MKNNKPFSDSNQQRSKAEDQICRNAPHEKTASDIPDETDLPITVLRKDIPATEIHDM